MRISDWSSDVCSSDLALQAGYLELAQAEYDEGDYRDSDTFAERSIRAAGGGDVQPEAISARDLPDNMVGTLTSSRERLMAVLAAGAAQSDPTQAEEAQVAFDCWMQEQESSEARGVGTGVDGTGRCRGVPTN